MEFYVLEKQPILSTWEVASNMYSPYYIRESNTLGMCLFFNLGKIALKSLLEGCQKEASADWSNDLSCLKNSYLLVSNS